MILPRPRTHVGRDARGGTAATFAITGALLVAAGGFAVDYANVMSLRGSLQTIADGAALAAVRELRLGNASAQTISQVASAYANAALSSAGLTATVAPTIDTTAKTVTVDLTGTPSTWVMNTFELGSNEVSVRATAKVVGGAPICVIGLNGAQQQTVHLAQTAHLKAPGCSVYSDSTNVNGLVVQDDAVLEAAYICSAGGKSRLGAGVYSPTPETDCPEIPDPLSARPTPTVPSSCLKNNYTITSGSDILKPGLYCGGITVQGTAQVKLEPGTYVVRGGALLVTDQASFTGVNTGFYLTGNQSRLRFEGAATISLTAPKTGTLAGILVFVDPKMPNYLQHEISADNANTLLGTLYLPKGWLDVSANKPVADKSAYTIVVADRFTLGAGPTMVLNTNYSSTDVPVPDGVGPNGTKAYLSK